MGKTYHLVNRVAVRKYVELVRFLRQLRYARNLSVIYLMYVCPDLKTFQIIIH